MHTESGSGDGSSAAGARMMTARMAATTAHSGVDANGILEDLTVAMSYMTLDSRRTGFQLPGSSSAK
jgi:hypothetical protein